MSYQYPKKIALFILLFCIWQLTATNSYSQTNTPENTKDSFKRGFYGGVEMGAGWLELSQNNQTEGREARFIFGLYAGYRPFRALKAGIKIDGYLIEAYDNSNPAEGISISNTHFHAQVFPFKKIALFANLQGGWSKYINQNFGKHDAKGSSQKIGLGYEYTLAEHLRLSLLGNYGFGKFKDVNDVMITVHDQHFDSWDITLCITYQ